MTRLTVDEIESAGPLRRGLLVWYAAFGGIGAWTAHLMFETSAVEWTRDDPRWRWTLHAVTAACVLATVLAMALALRLRRVANGAKEAGADDAGQLLFLGNLGLLVGAINLALIVLEGAYVLVIPVR
jgi:hypothetical protein